MLRVRECVDNVNAGGL